MAELLDFPKQLEEQTQKLSSSSKTMDAIMQAPPVLIRVALTPYTGVWDQHTARHLLKRAMFAPNAQQIAEAVADGLELTIQKLFSPAPDPGFPLNYNEPNDPNVPIGETWVNQPITMNLNYPQRSLRAW